jgi:hypothetical protein
MEETHKTRSVKGLAFKDVSRILCTVQRVRLVTNPYQLLRLYRHISVFTTDMIAIKVMDSERYAYIQLMNYVILLLSLLSMLTRLSFLNVCAENKTLGKVRIT